MGLFDFISKVGSKIYGGIRKVGEFVTSKSNIGKVTGIVRKIADFGTPIVSMLPIPPQYKGGILKVLQGAKTTADVVDTATDWMNKVGVLRD